MVVDNLSAAFAALSDPTRRRILDHLTHGPAIVNDLVSKFEISQQGISKHVAYLERSRLIVKVRRGREQVCSLKVDALKDVAEWADGYRRFWEARLDKFGQALARKKTGQQTKETKNEH
jgi:DNA-binding transcriptional ArsR family regulator